MKNYNEMAQSVLNRIHEYETAKKRQKKICIRAAVPICCLCAAIMAGVAIHGAGVKDIVSTPQNGSSQSNQNMTQSTDSASDTDETKHAYINGDMLGLVVIDGKEYIQDFTDYVIEEAYTADKLLGDAHDFEGTYKTADDTISAELYTVKESKNVLLVKLGNGGTVVLIREGELCVNGKDYLLSDSNGNGEIKETCIGKAKPYIIDVPTRQNHIDPNDILWTVSGDENKLIAVKPNGTCTVYSTEEN